MTQTPFLLAPQLYGNELREQRGWEGGVSVAIALICSHNPQPTSHYPFLLTTTRAGRTSRSPMRKPTWKT
jgi:hypothetical protein